MSNYVQHWTPNLVCEQIHSDDVIIRRQIKINPESDQDMRRIKELLKLTAFYQKENDNCVI